MSKATKIACLVAVLGAALPGLARADSETKRFCSDSLVRGTYAIQLSGTRPAPGGVTESVIGVVIRLYDGAGGVLQTDNVKGSVTGITPDRVGSGTYRVNDDCTVDVEFHPGPGITLREKAVIVDEGRELRSITVEPAGVMVTSTQQRI
jgi:hypothetical protein